MRNPTLARWPKQLPELSAEQKRISDDFMRHWHEVLPRRYGIVDDFNHRYPVRHAPSGFRRTLEIGAGIGEHLEYEKLSLEQQENYYALELRQNMAEQIRARFPQVHVVVGDCQARLDLPGGYFDRILAVHVLEHLPNLPAAVTEMHRLCDPDRGVFSVVIPCEGSAAYSLARRFSAQRIFEKRYRQSYRWFIEREHINRPREIIGVLRTRFDIVHRTFFPLPIALLAANLCIGLTLRPRRTHAL
ncbi:MAG TPA: class I SAM-dependent methyltransferase [Chthoniobacterales bacterium]